MRYVHTNLIARDWRALSRFYQRVFGCIPAGDRNLRGEWLDRLTGMQGVHITGEHLLLPGYGPGGPTLEIFSYDEQLPLERALYREGFAHIAFAVEDVAATAALLLREGGSLVGKMVQEEYESLGTGTFVYARDPEGNIVELQSWQKNTAEQEENR